MSIVADQPPLLTVLELEKERQHVWRRFGLSGYGFLPSCIDADEEQNRDNSKVGEYKQKSGDNHTGTSTVTGSNNSSCGNAYGSFHCANGNGKLHNEQMVPLGEPVERLPNYFNVWDELAPRLPLLLQRMGEATQTIERLPLLRACSMVEPHQ